jgi:hypothetical protein
MAAAVAQMTGLAMQSAVLSPDLAMAVPVRK